MTGANDTALAVHLATLTAKVSALTETVNRDRKDASGFRKEALEMIGRLSTAIDELRNHFDNRPRVDLARLESRIEEAARRTERVEKEQYRWKDRATGAVWVIGIAAAAIGAMLSKAIAWIAEQ